MNYTIIHTYPTKVGTEFEPKENSENGKFILKQTKTTVEVSDIEVSEFDYNIITHNRKPSTKTEMVAKPIPVTVAKKPTKTEIIVKSDPVNVVENKPTKIVNPVQSKTTPVVKTTEKKQIAVEETKTHTQPGVDQNQKKVELSKLVKLRLSTIDKPVVVKPTTKVIELNKTPIAGVEKVVKPIQKPEPAKELEKPITFRGSYNISGSYGFKNKNAWFHAFLMSWFSGSDQYSSDVLVTVSTIVNGYRNEVTTCNTQDKSAVAKISNTYIKTLITSLDIEKKVELMPYGKLSELCNCIIPDSVQSISVLMEEIKKFQLLADENHSEIPTNIQVRILAYFAQCRIVVVKKGEIQINVGFPPHDKQHIGIAYAKDSEDEFDQLMY